MNVLRNAKESGGDDFVVAHGVFNCIVTIKGMDGGGSTHKHLMIRVSNNFLSLWRMSIEQQKHELSVKNMVR